MQIHHLDHCIRGFYRIVQIGQSGEMNDYAQYLINVLCFREIYVTAAACNAFKLSWRTLYRFRFRVSFDHPQLPLCDGRTARVNKLTPVSIRQVLSDNGSEFMKDFETELKNRGITYWWTYPKSPKMNAHCERFNRTLQESFIDYHEEELFTDIDGFNRALAGWLVFYNTERPHQALPLRFPVQSLLISHPECQMLWTHTRICAFDKFSI